MEFNSNLPVLVPGVITFVVISVAAAFVLALNRRPEIRKLVGRVWLAISVAIVAGVAVFWISTAMVEGPPRSTIDRSLQDQQQRELHQRLQNGGH